MPSPRKVREQRSLTDTVSVKDFLTAAFGNAKTSKHEDGTIDYITPKYTKDRIRYGNILKSPKVSFGEMIMK